MVPPPEPILREPKICGLPASDYLADVDYRVQVRQDAIDKIHKMLSDPKSPCYKTIQGLIKDNSFGFNSPEEMLKLLDSMNPSQISVYGEIKFPQLCPGGRSIGKVDSGTIYL